VNTDENLAKEIRALARKVESLEEKSSRPIDLDNQVSANSDESNSLSLIMKRINAVQNLVDQIEIEIDKLEMRVSAIEHMGFRLRTDGQ
jgi:DNA-directed RNA polymerase sigma subunit (sigma70/sigma32)